MPENSAQLLQAAIDSLQALLTARSVPAEPSALLADVEGFEPLYATLLEVRTAIMAFSAGDLSYRIQKKGYVPGSIKALQGSLHHLTWQTRMIASGDFSQRVDFMGDFSESFNSMVKQLDESMHKLTAANAQLEESQRRILEGLNCARVIQNSILPQSALFRRLFPEWLTIYRPCEIVGGDLYWLREINGQILLAVIDCTGHGVPGAIMTMTVNSVLNHVVDTICSDDPARILKETNRVLQETLHLRRDGESTVDAGLDIVLCCLDPAARMVTSAGAGLALYLLDDGELVEIKGDRAGIGYSSSNPEYAFRNNVRNLGAGTVCYAITDGFLDESGGSKGYGFGRQNFKEMLKNASALSLERQRDFFEQALDTWRGTRNQRDDITMVGFRL
ncbi:MAG TPA: SpoIIE family protein phosphatase [Desulfuromonadales bacterium]|nr:SpoIIE family protein phosphatase [Desulfuromonadales bacterium]